MTFQAIERCPPVQADDLAIRSALLLVTFGACDIPVSASQHEPSSVVIEAPRLPTFRSMASRTIRAFIGGVVELATVGFLSRMASGTLAWHSGEDWDGGDSFRLRRWCVTFDAGSSVSWLLVRPVKLE